MAGIYTDNDVPLRVAPLLRARGHDVTTTRDLGRTAARDDDQLLLAAQRGWTLVTHNRRDYELLHDAWRRWFSAFGIVEMHAGILVLPQKPQLSAEQIAQEVDALLTSGAPLANELYRWQRLGGWLRRPVPL